MTEPIPHVERERRFLVDEPDFLEGASSTDISQAYIFTKDGYAVRVRIETTSHENSRGPDDAKASLTAKGPRVGDERDEYEIALSVEYALEIIQRAEWIIEKRRYSFPADGQVWDVDVFAGNNEGLIIAELEGVDIRDVKPPWWAVREITSDSRFNNEELAKFPVSQWGNDEDWRSDPIWG